MGALPSDGISVFAYARLLKELGNNDIIPKIFDVFQFLAEVDSPVLDRLGGDFVQVHRMRYRFGISEKKWKSSRLPCGLLCQFPYEYAPKEDAHGALTIYMDGEPCARMPVDGLYFDQISHPLSGVSNPSGLHCIHPADYMTDEEIDYIVRRVEMLFRSTDKGIVLIFGGSIFDQAQRDFGSEDFYYNLAAEPELMHTHFNSITDANITNLKRILDRCGDKVDVVHFFDDIGSQKTLLISLGMYREMIKPYHRKQCRFIKDAYPGVKVLMHCCGAIFDLIPDFIDIGIDILNPVQISAAGMDPQALKDEYGDKMLFWGGGVDTQGLAKMQDIEELRAHVDALCRVFSCGGGYVFSPVHNLQAGVTPEQILTIFDTAAKYRS